ncbi:MAG: hypothetical protein FJZ04_03750 [Candidatus Moranbacteria bacterium]|nr:hypothetical protein [Candidatus Moranbacteria bacterium]
MRLETKATLMVKENKISKNSDKVRNWQPLRELALITPYTMGYLSLMSRRGQLKVKKIGRIWYSTLENIREFEREMRERKEERKKELSRKYQEISRPKIPISNYNDRINTLDPRVPPLPTASDGQSKPEDDNENSYKPRIIRHEPEPGASTDLPHAGSQIGSYKLQVTEDSIFDEVQRELQEVLGEIREKEKIIKKELTAEGLEQTAKNIAKTGDHLEALEKERQETEELSEKLVADLGKLLKTADEVQDQAEESVLEGTAEWVPVRNIGDYDPGSEKAREDFGIADPFYYTPAVPRDRKTGDYELQKRKPQDNFLYVPYNAHPFEYRRRDFERTKGKKTNWLLLFLAALMIAVAGMLFTLVVVG